jgi:hypothetical protein
MPAQRARCRRSGATSGRKRRAIATRNSKRRRSVDVEKEPRAVVHRNSVRPGANECRAQGETRHVALYRGEERRAGVCHDLVVRTGRKADMDQESGLNAGCRKLSPRVRFFNTDPETRSRGAPTLPGLHRGLRVPEAATNVCLSSRAGVRFTHGIGQAAATSGESDAIEQREKRRPSPLP